MNDQKKPEALEDDELDAVQGGLGNHEIQRFTGKGRTAEDSLAKTGDGRITKTEDSKIILWEEGETI